MSPPPAAPAECPSSPRGMAPGFRALYASTLAPLRRYLARMLGHAEAQDVAQDAFLRVHAVMSERTLTRPQAYLFTTARRLAIDELRRRRADPLHHPAEGVVLEGVFSSHPGTERIVMARQDLDQLMRDIDALPPGCRTVFLLSRIEELSHRQIADRLGISCSTVEKQHARALRLLRQARREAGTTPLPPAAATGTHGPLPRTP